MDHEQQELLLKRLSDLKTPQKTVKRILDALESKDKIIDSLTIRAQLADELQSQCKDLKTEVEAKIKQVDILSTQLQQKQEHVAYLERLVEFLEQQATCRTRQLSIQQQQQTRTKKMIESKQKEEMEDWIRHVAEMKYELAAAKVDYLSAEVRNRELEEQVNLLSHDKAKTIQYYEERMKQLEEDMKKQEKRNESRIAEYQQKLEERDRWIGELENGQHVPEKTTQRLVKDRKKLKPMGRYSSRPTISESPTNSAVTCNASQQDESNWNGTQSSLQASPCIETVLKQGEGSETTRKNKNEPKNSNISSSKFGTTNEEESEEESVRSDEVTQEQGDEPTDTFKENQGNMHNFLQAEEAVSELPTKKYREDNKKRGVEKAKQTNTKLRDTAAESNTENVQSKRKKKLTSEKNKKSGTLKGSSFGLYSVGSDIAAGDSSSLVGPSTIPNSAITSLRIPQLAFSMTKDGKVVFDAFKP